MDARLHGNLTCYEGMERLDMFDDASFAAYCSAKLTGAGPAAGFLRREFGDLLGPGSVCEIGSGNSKLLYRLEQDGLLSRGIGYEVSASRHGFAERFGVHAGSCLVENRLADVLGSTPERDIDVCIGVDVVACLIVPVAPCAEARLLDWCFQSLRSGGALVLELCDWSVRLEDIDRHGGCLKTWQAFAEPDPWAFMLESTRRAGGRDIIWDKLFLKRGSGEQSQTSMVLRSYTPSDAVTAFEQAGFAGIAVHDSWGPDAEMSAGEFIVAGRKS